MVIKKLMKEAKTARLTGEQSWQQLKNSSWSMPEYVIHRLLPSDSRPEFDCKDNDLDGFFAVDSIVSGQELLSVTYIVAIDGVL
jgi:hypothetical protein